MARWREKDGLLFISNCTKKCPENCHENWKVGENNEIPELIPELAAGLSNLSCGKYYISWQIVHTSDAENITMLDGCKFNLS